MTWDFHLTLIYKRPSFISNLFTWEQGEMNGRKKFGIIPTHLYPTPTCKKPQLWAILGQKLDTIYKQRVGYDWGVATPIQPVIAS